jgi:hypothetical protein
MLIFLICCPGRFIRRPSSFSFYLLSLFYLYTMGEYSIGDALKKFLEGSRIKGGIQALQIEDAWEDIMGKTVARYTDKIQIIGDKLFITTQVAPLKNELKFQKEKIKQRVNEALGQKVVNEVIIN